MESYVKKKKKIHGENVDEREGEREREMRKREGANVRIRKYACSGVNGKTCLQVFFYCLVKELPLLQKLFR